MMKTLGSVLLVVLFVLVTIWRVKPEWLGLGHKTPTATHFDTSKLKRLASTCEAYSDAIGPHIDRLEHATSHMASSDPAAQRAAVAELATVLHADHDALARIVPPTSITAQHARWIAASDELASAADALRAAFEANAADRVTSTTAALRSAAGAHDAALDAIVAQCR